MNSKELATAFDTISTLLELKGENPFKIKAYQNAARSLEVVNLPLEEVIRQIEKGELKGLGTQMRELIQEAQQNNRISYLEELKASTPPGLLNILKLPGLGPKKVKLLYEELQISDISQLTKACEEGRVAELRGFGEKTEKKILQAIAKFNSYSSKCLLSTADSEYAKISASLAKSTHCQKISATGILRRKHEVVEELSLLASSSEPEKLVEEFTRLEQIEFLTLRSATLVQATLKSGIPIKLHVTTPEHFTEALLLTTGTEEHIAQLKERAEEKNIKLSLDTTKDSTSELKNKSEEEIFSLLNLAYIPPELRENNGEIQEAEELYRRRMDFPKLVEKSDLKGIIHTHSTYSDGKNTLIELASAVKNMGFEYLGISDHSQSAVYAGGLSIDAIKRQHEEIDRLNESLKPFYIFKGIESDILADGSLDYPEKVLESFDFVIASVHSRFSLNKEEMTNRIITATQNPYTTILGHLTGRLLLQREGYEIDIEKILYTAAESKVAIELNSDPRRLELDWRFLRKAKELKIPVPINPDAHTTDGLNNIDYGIGIARKGWLTKEDVLNCKSKEDIAKYFKKLERTK